MSHKWDVLEDMVVCSHYLDGDVNNKRVIKAICKEFNITPKQLSARVNNFRHLAEGRPSFWHTSRNEREVFKALVKHQCLVF